MFRNLLEYSKLLFLCYHLYILVYMENMLSKAKRFAVILKRL